MIQSSGTIVWEMLEALLGKKIPGALRSIRTSEDKWANTTLVLQSYQALFAYLHSQGAFLNVIRPEFLLDLEDFMRVRVIETIPR